MFRLEKVIFKDVLDIESLKIEKNKVTCITGKSGSGKTTLMKLLNGLISPDSGEVYVDDQPVSDWDLVSLRRHVIMLQQTPSIYEGTIRDNLNIAREFSGLSPATDEELEQALQQVHLHKPLDQDIEDLSGGEKQRVALARIELLNSEAVLLDEPTSALDEDTADAIIQDLFNRFKEKGQTIVMVTHSSELVQKYADHVVHIVDGHVTEEKGAL